MINRVIIILMVFLAAACESANITYGGTDCTGTVETTRKFVPDEKLTMALYSYDYLFGFTLFSVGYAVDSVCPSKPVKVDFTCLMDTPDSLDVFVGVTLFNGSTEVAAPHLDWNGGLSPNMISGSCEFTGEKKSTETSFSVGLSFSIGTEDVIAARNFLLSHLKEYVIEVSYARIQ